MLPFLSRILFSDMEIGVFRRKMQLSAVGKVRGSSLLWIERFQNRDVDWSCGYDSTGGPRRSRRHGEHAEDSKTSRGLIGPVSHVLNNTATFREPRRTRVLQAVRALGY